MKNHGPDNQQHRKDGHNHNDHVNDRHEHVGHDHDSHSHHGHHHAPANFGSTFALAVALNAAFVAVEFIYGLIANSTALMADAGHNLSDVLGLLLAWLANRLALKAPSTQYTYGYRSSSILAALGNAMLLLLACGAIGLEALQRLFSPATQAIPSTTVMAVAAVGIVINGISAWLFMRGSKDDLNIRGAYLHMATDALVSLGVVVAGALMLWTQQFWIDAAVSLIIIVVILVGTWQLLRESVGLALAGVPKNISYSAIREYLGNYHGVSEVHDLHIWAMSTTETALTAHLVMPAGYPGDAAMDDIAKTLLERYKVQHSTVQIQQSKQSGCSLVNHHHPTF